MTYTAKKITAVLVVQEIEPSLEFWENRLGFTKVAEVPHENALGFIILVKDGLELMYQTEASVKADFAATGPVPGKATSLFMEVSDLADVERALAGYPLAMQRRTTFYGMHEIAVREPGGHWITFARQAE
jgi:uncharacterized glyoxalase superfamily protein PhnB